MQHAIQISLQQSDWPIRIRAVRELERLGKQAPLELLAMALHDQDHSVRATVVRALGLREEKAAHALLQEALHDPDWHVREIAILQIRHPLKGHGQYCTAQPCIQTLHATRV